jgi:hypothetical protein
VTPRAARLQPAIVSAPHGDELAVDADPATEEVHAVDREPEALTLA